MGSLKTRIFFRDAYETVKDANAILPFMDGAFVEEFFERVRAIGEAIARENGWTDRELARMFTRPDLIYEVELGNKAIAKLEEFRAWFTEHGHFSIDI